MADKDKKVRVKGYEWSPDPKTVEEQEAQSAVNAEVKRLQKEIEKEIASERRPVNVGGVRAPQHPSPSPAPARSSEDQVKSSLMRVLRYRGVKDPDKAFVQAYGSLDHKARSRLVSMYNEAKLAADKGDSGLARSHMTLYFETINSLADTVAPFKPGAKTLEARAYDTVMKDVKTALKGVKDANSLMTAYGQDGTIERLVKLQVASTGNPQAQAEYHRGILSMKELKMKKAYK